MARLRIGAGFTSRTAQLNLLGKREDIAEQGVREIRAWQLPLLA